MNCNQPSEKMEQKIMTSGYDTHRVETSIKDFDNIMGSIHQPIVMLDSDLKVVKANRSFCYTFNIKPEETEGILIYE